MRLVDASEIEGLPFVAEGLVAVIQGRDILGLPLDHGELEEWLREPPRHLAGMVVEGDLRAKYAISNTEPKGAFLWVKGNLEVPDLSLHGSRVRVDGELQTRALTGPIEVLGNLRCQLLYAQPRPIHVHGSLAARLVVGRIFTDPSTAIVGWWNEEGLLHPDLLVRGVAEDRLVRGAIAMGQPLFADSEDEDED